jgi:hypothetical protein
LLVKKYNAPTQKGSERVTRNVKRWQKWAAIKSDVEIDGMDGIVDRWMELRKVGGKRRVKERISGKDLLTLTPYREAATTSGGECRSDRCGHVPLMPAN